MEEDEIKTNPGVINNDKFGSKDFTKFAYFVSKAKNHTVIVKPQLEEIMANGEVKISRDENGKEMMRVVVEFHNGMIKFEYEPMGFDGEVDVAMKEMNRIKIEYLRRIVLKEMELSEKSKSIKEVKKPIKLYTEEEVKNLLAVQDKANAQEEEKEVLA